MVLACTGGGTLVPIFINSIPVSLSQDAYPIAIIASFLLHQYVPILREIMGLSPILKVYMASCSWNCLGIVFTRPWSNTLSSNLP